MIRKTGTFSAPDPEVYDWSILESRMMQAYGYFIWFAAQRVKPYTGVLCMITASQWLTLEFASKLRAWLFDNCLMDEFYQFEPFKVFSKVQTDSLIFKVRALNLPHTDAMAREKALQAHTTVFLRHTDHHKPLNGILQDYMDFSPSSSTNNDFSIMASIKTRQELSVAIFPPLAPSSAPTPPPSVSGVNLDSTPATTAAAEAATATIATTVSVPSTWTYSFAPMMPSSGLTTYLLALTQDLGGICSAGARRMKGLSAAEPLQWHRGPNTNPVYGLVTRMDYARANFGETMTKRWFKPAFYWNGKNSPEEIGGGPNGGVHSTKVMHKEGLFWQTRDRLRLSKKEGSPAESYLIPLSTPQRTYALCMVDKESVKILRQQVDQGEEGSLALWRYLTDVRNHFQPGLASKKRKAGINSKQQAVDDDGVAFCSTNQCGFDISEKIVHPINYGYFSKTQPRQRFFLDTNSLAVTNQCIYLTPNPLSQHFNAQPSPPLIYFLTLLNSTTLQFFVLHHCQYDQQGRMRLFRESMAKIPFQDRDVKYNPERMRYASKLGELMIELKDILYAVVAKWQLNTNVDRNDQRRLGHSNGSTTDNTSGQRPLGPTRAEVGDEGLGKAVRIGDRLVDGSISASVGVGTHTTLLDWVRRGGDAPAGLLVKVRGQIRRMLSSAAVAASSSYRTPPISQSSSMSSIAHSAQSGGTFGTDTDSDTRASTDTDTETDDNVDSPRSPPLQRADTALNGLPSESRLRLVTGSHMNDLDIRFSDTMASPEALQDNMIAEEDHSTDIYHRRLHSSVSFTSDTSTLATTSATLSHSQAIADSEECERILQAIERAVTMLELVQWAIDQYGYMLYGIKPKYQKLLELELKIVYSSTIDALVAPTSPVSNPIPSKRMFGPRPDETISETLPDTYMVKQQEEVERSSHQYQHQGQHQLQHQPQLLESDSGASRLGIAIPGLHRWDENSYDSDDDARTGAEHNGDTCDSSYVASFSVTSTTAPTAPKSGVHLREPEIPVYGSSILENAQMTVQNLRNFLQQYP
ncbi:hypothetical protein BCR41DRAFT_325923, partial [Lobosporangium transversale]